VGWPGLVAPDLEVDGNDADLAAAVRRPARSSCSGPGPGATWRVRSGCGIRSQAAGHGVARRRGAARRRRAGLQRGGARRSARPPPVGEPGPLGRDRGRRAAVVRGLRHDGGDRERPVPAGRRHRAARPSRRRSFGGAGLRAPAARTAGDATQLTTSAACRTRGSRRPARVVGCRRPVAFEADGVSVRPSAEVVPSAFRLLL
jgi:hypothetical protein